MTDAQEQILCELANRGPLTWFRLDALLSAAGFRIGPALFAEVEQLEREGSLELVKPSHGPKTYRATPKGERLAKYLAEVNRQHHAWLHGRVSDADATSWDWLPAEPGLRDTADPALGPRRSA